MKKHTKILALAAIAATVGFTSCEKEKIVGVDNITGVQGDPANASNGKIPDSLLSRIKFNGTMLVFADRETFAKTYEALAGMEISQNSPKGPASLISFERNFPGFQSLRSMVQQQVNELVKARKLTTANDPEDLFISDIVLRALINEKSEVMVGNETVILTKEALEEFAESQGGSESRGVTCCLMYKDKTNDIYNGNLTKMIRCKSWVYYVPVASFGVTGSSTRSYHLLPVAGTPYYTMTPTNVNMIRTGSHYGFTVLFCHNDIMYWTTNGAANHSNFVQSSFGHWTFIFPFFIRNRDVKHSADYYTGSDIDVTLDFCL